MIELKDQIHQTIRLSQPAKRIVSLVPSQTEFLADIQLTDEVVGITKFCVHPQEWYQNKTRVGGTKNVHFDKIKSLNPDLIIANKEENTQADIEYLQQFYPVYTSDIFTLEDAYQMMLDVGILCGKQDESIQFIHQIKTDFLNLPQWNIKAVYLIWKNPYMSVNEHTFIHQMMKQAGITNVVKSTQSRYPELSLDDIKSMNPDIVLLSSEPYPFKNSDVNELSKKLKIEVQLVDGEMFSWYGSRLKLFKTYLESLIKR